MSYFILQKQTSLSPDPSSRTKRSIKLYKIKIIQDPRKTVALSNDLVRSAKHEILRIYPSINQFYRQVRIGVLQIFREALERGITVRVLVPCDRHEMDKMVNEVEFGLPKLDIRWLGFGSCFHFCIKGTSSFSSSLILYSIEDMSLLANFRSRIAC